MAKLFCRFCGHEWEEDLGTVFRCPDCEYADTPDMFQVLDWGEEEILRLWHFLETKLRAMPKLQADQLQTLFVPKTADRPWDRLLLESLVFDRLYVVEQWKLLFSGSHPEYEPYVPLFKTLVDCGIVIPVEDPETLFPARWVVKDLAPSLRSTLEGILCHPNYVNLFDVLSEGPSQLPVVNYWALERFAHFQTGEMLLRNRNTRSRLDAAFRSAFPGGMGPDFYKTFTQGNRFQILAVLLDCQLSLYHEWVSPVVVELARGYLCRSDVVNELLFENKYVFTPKPSELRRFLAIRDAPECVRMRESLKQTRLLSVDDIKANLADLNREIEQHIDRLNRRIEAIGEAGSLVLGGVLATAGSLFGGLHGAILGGIGGVAIGKASEVAVGSVLRKTNRHWTMLLPRFKSRQ